MYKLSGLDAGFLYNETERCPQHVSSVQVMELPEGVDEDTFIEGLKEMFRSRLHLVPYLINKLLETPFMIDHPVWVPDADFDIDHHIFRMDLAAPGGRAELEAAVATLHEARLDRGRPLWRTVVLCGLEEGRIAYYSGAHHACLDGMAGQAATTTLMDTTVEPREVSPAPKDFLAAKQPSMADLVVAAWENIIQFQIRQATGLLDAVETGIRLQRRLLDTNAFDTHGGLGAMAEEAPRTRFNAAIEGARSYAVGAMDLAAVKLAAKANGGTLNDVFLAICGGGLRRYFERTGELPEKPMIAGCPVSLRKLDDTSMNNQVTMMQVSLATDEANAAMRIAAIRESAAIAKGVTADLAAAFESDPAGWGMPLAMRTATSVMEVARTADVAVPPFNVVISNVPGPRQTLYSNGARMLTHYPVSIPAHGLGVNITVQSYTDKLFIGITACARAVPDAGALRDDIVEEYEALCSAFLPEEAAPVPVEPTPLPVATPRTADVPAARAAWWSLPYASGRLGIDSRFCALHNTPRCAVQHPTNEPKSHTMNPFEKQLQIGRELFELNATAWRRMVELDADSFRTFVETNQSFFSRLPEVKDLPSLVTLQREYGETVWNGAQSSMKARGEIMRDSIGKAGELFRGAFDQSTAETTEQAAA